MNALSIVKHRVFKKERCLIVGCGDVGSRALKQLINTMRVSVLTRDAHRDDWMRHLGARLMTADLDNPATLQRLTSLGTRILYLAPPPLGQSGDARSLAFSKVLRGKGQLSGRASSPRRRSFYAKRHLVYASTSGVYGDAKGAWVDETTPANATTPRARKRIVAENIWRRVGQTHQFSVTILRIPGIYALDRAGGNPRDRLLKGSPVLTAEDDVYTNHIHADDLARACVMSLWRGWPQRVWHISDDSALKMSEYFDLAADLMCLPRPPRISWAEAQTQLSSMILSFWSESRRLCNQRMKKELKLSLRYPTVMQGLQKA